MQLVNDDVVLFDVLTGRHLGSHIRKCLIGRYQGSEGDVVWCKT
jgi:hypothetical protein